MENLIKNNTNIKVTIGVLIVFIGICITSSTYFNQKKFQVYDEMNDLYYSQLIIMDNELEELDNDDQNIIGDLIEEPAVSETTVSEQAIVPIIDYSKYYIGYLNIPKIELKKGFTETDSRYNNVNRNIEIIKPSNYPDIEKGNFIIAAHSGSSSVSFFKDLYKLELGDELYISYKELDYKYIIKNIYTDTKDGNISIKRKKEVTTLTLITCTKGDKTTQTIYIAERA